MCAKVRRMEDTKKTTLEESCPEQEKLIEDLMAQICELKLNIKDQTATIEDQTATIESQNSTIKDQNTTIAIQKATIEELKQRLYGRKSEHHKKGKKGEPNGAPSNNQSTDSQNPKDIKEETVNRKDYLDTQELPNADPVKFLVVTYRRS
jgi:uncharacterized coiled-coil protein SlyX